MSSIAINKSRSRLKEQYKSTLKSADTEEHIDLWFYRPVGFVVAKVSARLGMTPNFLTFLSIFLGVGAGVAFYPGNFWINVCGIVLLVSANILDSADGQLARFTGQFSRLGRILDGMAGDLWFITIYVSICLREVVTSGFFEAHAWAIWMLASVAGLSHILQAQMADRYRQFHLFLLFDKGVSELENLQDLERQVADSADKGLLQRLLLKFYLNYSRQQARLSPTMQRLLGRWEQTYSGKVPEELRARVRAMSLPLMKYTNILSFNWRCIVLVASLLMRMPWIYFAVEISVFNGILIYMVRRHEKMCKQLLDED